MGVLTYFQKRMRNVIKFIQQQRHCHTIQSPLITANKEVTNASEEVVWHH